MSQLFLGRPLHWLVLVAVCAGLWFAGAKHFHVIHFNVFVILLVAISAICVLIVLNSAKGDGRLTRDDIVPDETENRVSGD